MMGGEILSAVEELRSSLDGAARLQSLELLVEQTAARMVQGSHLGPLSGETFLGRMLEETNQSSLSSSGTQDEWRSKTHEEGVLLAVKEPVRRGRQAGW